MMKESMQTANVVENVEAEAIYFGELPIAPDTELVDVEAAAQTVTPRGRCKHRYYRMLWDKQSQSWEYFSHRQLMRGRSDKIFERVPPGTLLAQHDYAEPVKRVLLATADKKNPLFDLKFHHTAGGLEIEFPSGRVILLPDPRRR